MNTKTKSKLLDTNLRNVRILDLLIINIHMKCFETIQHATIYRTPVVKIIPNPKIILNNFG